jgi:hypothetical protein
VVTEGAPERTAADDDAGSVDVPTSIRPKTKQALGYDPFTILAVRYGSGWSAAE